MSFGLIKFLKEQQQFLVLIGIWVLCGMFAGPLIYFVVPLSLLLMKRRGMHLEMLLGFFLILTLSDSRQISFHFATSIKDIYLLLLAVFLLFDRANFKPLDQTLKRYIPFFLIAVFSLIFATVFITSAQKTLSYILLLLVVPNYLIRAWHERGYETLRTLIWVGVSILIWGLLIRVINPDFVTLKGRYSGILGNPNGLGLFCMIFFILFTMIREMKTEAWTRAETIFIYVIVGFSLYYCGSRNALLTVIIFFVFRSFYKMSPFLGFVLLLAFIVIYQFVFVNAELIIVSLGLQDYFRLETLENGSGRLIAWEFGWDYIEKSPMVGSGIGYTDDLFRRNYGILSIQGHQGNAHNSYITFWLDTGIFGLLAYLFATFSAFLSGAKRTRSALPALYAVLFSAFFESWLTASLNPFTIQFFIIMTLIASPVFDKQAMEEVETALATSEEELQQA